MNNHKLFSVDDVAKIFVVTPNVVRHWAYWGRIGHIRPTHRIYFRQCDLDEFIKNYSIPRNPNKCKYLL